MARRGALPQSLREYEHPPGARLGWPEWLLIAAMLGLVLAALCPGRWPEWLFQLPLYAIYAGLLAAVASAAVMAVQGLAWLLRRIRGAGR